MINTKMSISIQKRITTASTFISCCLHLFCSVLHCCDFDGDSQRKQYKTFLFLTNPNLHIFTHYLLYTHSHTYKIHITHAHCRKIHNTINIITHFQEYLFMLQIVTFELSFIPWWKNRHYYKQLTWHLFRNENPIYTASDTGSGISDLSCK